MVLYYTKSKFQICKVYQLILWVADIQMHYYRKGLDKINTAVDEFVKRGERYYRDVIRSYV